MEYGLWLRASSPTCRQEKGGNRHSKRPGSSKYEKLTKDGNRHYFSGDEDMDQDDSGDHSESFSNPKRTKVQKERCENLGVNYGINYGSQRANNITKESHAKGNQSTYGSRDLRKVEKENNLGVCMGLKRQDLLL